MEYSLGIFRWLHIMAGITWIGLLYYFNLVQVPAMKDATADGTAAGISKHVAPRALLWFRWAAVATWLMGAALLGPNFSAAFGLQGNLDKGRFTMVKLDVDESRLIGGMQNGTMIDIRIDYN